MTVYFDFNADFDLLMMGDMKIYQFGETNITQSFKDTSSMWFYL